VCGVRVCVSVCVWGVRGVSGVCLCVSVLCVCGVRVCVWYMWRVCGVYACGMCGVRRCACLCVVYVACMSCICVWYVQGACMCVDLEARQHRRLHKVVRKLRVKKLVQY